MQQDSSDPEGVAGPRGNPSGPDRHAVRYARQRKADAALAMRIGGATWAEIAEGLGYPTPRQALVATEKALARQLNTEEDRAKMRRLAGQRLERMLRAIWAKAIDPENPDQMVAIGKARDLIDRHAKLYGLDAPTEVIVHNPTMAEIESWVAMVVQSGSPAVPQMDVIEGHVIEQVG